MRVLLRKGWVLVSLLVPTWAAAQVQGPRMVDETFEFEIDGWRDGTADEAHGLFEAIQNSVDAIRRPNYLDCTVQIVSVSMPNSVEQEAGKPARGVGALHCFLARNDETELRARMREAIVGPMSQKAGVTLTPVTEAAPKGVGRGFTAYTKKTLGKGQFASQYLGVLSSFDAAARALKQYYPVLDCEARLSHVAKFGADGLRIEGAVFCRSSEASNGALYHWLNSLIEYDLAKATGAELRSAKVYHGGVTGSN